MQAQCLNGWCVISYNIFFFFGNIKLKRSHSRFDQIAIIFGLLNVWRAFFISIGIIGTEIFRQHWHNSTTDSTGALNIIIVFQDKQDSIQMEIYGEGVGHNMCLKYTQRQRWYIFDKRSSHGTTLIPLSSPQFRCLPIALSFCCDWLIRDKSPILKFNQIYRGSHVIKSPFRSEWLNSRCFSSILDWPYDKIAVSRVMWKLAAAREKLRPSVLLRALIFECDVGK